MAIQRELYLDKLKARMNNGMIKIITGMRRSGKSFLLFNLFYNYLLDSGVKEDNIIGTVFLTLDPFSTISGPENEEENTAEE